MSNKVIKILSPDTLVLVGYDRNCCPIYKRNGDLVAPQRLIRYETSTGYFHYNLPLEKHHKFRGKFRKG